MAFQVELVA